MKKNNNNNNNTLCRVFFEIENADNIRRNHSAFIWKIVSKEIQCLLSMENGQRQIQQLTTGPHD